LTWSFFFTLIVLVFFHPHSFNCIKYDFFLISSFDVWFLYQICSSLFWLLFVFFLYFSWLDLSFYFHPSTFDFILFLYQIWSSFFSILFFWIFFVDFFYFYPSLFGWFEIRLLDFFGLSFYDSIRARDSFQMFKRLDSISWLGHRFGLPAKI